MHEALRAALLALLVAGAAFASGCVAQAEPATSVPLQSIAPRPPPVTAGEAVTIVGYELTAIHLGTRFLGEWNATSEATLQEMGFEPAGPAGLVFERDDDAHARVTPTPDGFWLNVSYERFDHVFASTLSEATALADQEWLELEPHFLGTVSHFTERTGADPQGHTERAHAFHARMGGGAP